MINHIFISFSTVQIYEISCIHFYGIGLHNTNTIIVFEAVPNCFPKVYFFVLTCCIQFGESNFFSSLPFYNVYNMKRKKNQINIKWKKEGINHAISINELQLRVTDAVLLQKVNFAAKSVPFMNRSLLIV